MLLQELDEILARDPPVLRTRNAISLESAGVEPLAHGSRGHLTDLCDLSCGEHLHMQDLRFPYVFLDNPNSAEQSWKSRLRPCLLTSREASFWHDCQSFDNAISKHLGQGFHDELTPTFILGSAFPKLKSAHGQLRCQLRTPILTQPPHPRAKVGRDSPRTDKCFSRAA